VRISAGVEYDGSRFSGWQYQIGQRTVQATLESAVASVADHSVTVITAGRTDAGVHADCQVVHFDTIAQRTPYQWLRGVNTKLPDDVSLLWVKEITRDFHARFSALNRSYRYIILNRSAPSALLHSKVCWDYRRLDVGAMRLAAATLIGEHDFSSFRAAGCQARNPVRNLSELSVREYSNWIWFDLVANAFLQHMVRNIVGTLTTVGVGDKPEHWPAEVLRARDRSQAGATAPPGGLYLTSIGYPEKYDLPARTEATRYW
jgi:tRNA pseudouridine38-40 synthase